MIFYIDFDHTLFDSRAYFSDLADHLVSLGIDREAFYRDLHSFSDEGGVCYNIRQHLDYFGFNIMNPQLQSYFNNFDHHIKTGAFELLEYIKEQGHCCILLSRGDEFTQHLKIDHTSLPQFFDEIIVTNRPKEEWFDQCKVAAEQIVIINDKPQENSALQKKIPGADIFLVEGPYSQGGHHGQCFYTLTELLNYFREMY